MERFLTSKARPKWSAGKVIAVAVSCVLGPYTFMMGLVCISAGTTGRSDDPAFDIIAGLLIIGLALMIMNVGIRKNVAPHARSREAITVAEHLAQSGEPEVDLAELGLGRSAGYVAIRVRGLIEGGYIENVTLDEDRCRVIVDGAARPEPPQLPRPTTYTEVCPHCGGISQLPETGPRACPYCGMRI